MELSKFGGKKSLIKIKGKFKRNQKHKRRIFQAERLNSISYRNIYVYRKSECTGQIKDFS